MTEPDKPGATDLCPYISVEQRITEQKRRDTPKEEGSIPKVCDRLTEEEGYPFYTRKPKLPEQRITEQKFGAQIGR